MHVAHSLKMSGDQATCALSSSFTREMGNQSFQGLPKAAARQPVSCLRDRQPSALPLPHFRPGLSFFGDFDRKHLWSAKVGRSGDIKGALRDNADHAAFLEGLGCRAFGSCFSCFDLTFGKDPFAPSARRHQQDLAGVTNVAVWQSTDLAYHHPLDLSSAVQILRFGADRKVATFMAAWPDRAVNNLEHDR
jgi:hypothetical protein